ncbi:RagB/SusD family nutrient uptake outer membrane protein [uncultured Prevotella sp.]|uniref:RagB/SusD family nutrient uptake outer membrane protein n=1 Tax=uncultured Prevotella sp. TaxID=159272 RepID=UPI002613A381|nr:RagB/SusD family nutrient uptake outer membrane protein [uncultured Prevotella sp.]
MKSYIKSIKLACMAMASMAMVSCLDFSPEAQMNDDSVWSKAKNFQLFANQFYTYTHDIQSGASYQYAVSDGPHSDTRSDLIAGANVNVYSQGTNTIPQSDGNYTTLYRQIYYTNLLLKKAASFGNQAAIAVPMAEAKFFRAYCYFELVQLYGNVILLTEPVDMDSPKMNAQRDDRSLVIDQCIKDLQEAAKDLPETASEAGRLTCDAAQAMLSRVALYEATWQKFHTGGADATTNSERVTSLLNTAKTAAKAVMEGGRYKLFYNDKLGTESYRYMFILEDEKCNPAGLTTKDNTEYILARRHKSTDGVNLNITKAYLTNAIYPTRKLANMYVCQNGLPITYNGTVNAMFKGYDQATSEYQNRDNRMLTTLAPRGTKVWDNTVDHCRTAWDDSDLARAKEVGATANSGYQTHKWAVERQVADRYECMDFPVIRYAEVLLNFAEAIYELQGRISDSDLDKSLNLVRLRSNPNMVKLSNALVDNNGLSMREEIRRERTVELTFEGFRIDDLKRWATAPVEMPQDQLGVKWKGTQFETLWANQSRQLNSEGCIILYDNRTWDDKLYLYPLPSDQLQLNPNIGQNPGWTK